MSLHWFFSIKKSKNERLRHALGRCCRIGSRMSARKHVPETQRIRPRRAPQQRKQDERENSVSCYGSLAENERVDEKEEKADAHILTTPQANRKNISIPS